MNNASEFNPDERRQSKYREVRKVCKTTGGLFHRFFEVKDSRKKPFPRSFSGRSSRLRPQILGLAEHVPDQGVQVRLGAQQPYVVRRQPPDRVEGVENFRPVGPRQRRHRSL